MYTINERMWWSFLRLKLWSSQGRGTATVPQSNDDDKSSPSTSMDNIQCSSYGRQIKKKVFDD